MAERRHKRILFLCTGNYYRSRFAEVLFNSVAGKMGLSWKASSRALALERGIYNVGPMSELAVQTLMGKGIHSPDYQRMPQQASSEELESADLIVALKDAEHRPLVQERYTRFIDRVEYWHIDDVPEVLGVLEREVMELVARLLGGGLRQAPADDAAPVELAKKEVAKSTVVRVGRETKGRRGKGVTIVTDLPLDEAGVLELAARLKQKCGTGGTVKEGRIEIQGDQRERISAELEAMGYKVKRVGG